MLRSLSLSGRLSVSSRDYSKQVKVDFRNEILEDFRKASKALTRVLHKTKDGWVRNPAGRFKATRILELSDEETRQYIYEKETKLFKEFGPHLV